MEFPRYACFVAETLSDRIARLTQGLSDTQVGEMMGTTADAARKLRMGEIRSMKLDNALRLCKRLGVSPWYLGGEVEPPPQGISQPDAEDDPVDEDTDLRLSLEEQVRKLRRQLLIVGRAARDALALAQQNSTQKARSRPPQGES